MLRHGWRVHAFLALGKRPELLFQAQMLSRDWGERHMPARRWCSAAIARYSVASIIVSSHAFPFRRRRRRKGRGTLERVPLE
jgi:hypothetical protein